MVSLIEFLPAIPHQYWTDFYSLINPASPLTLQPGQTAALFPENLSGKNGIFLSERLVCNSNKLTFNLTVDSVHISANIEDIYIAGYVGYFIPDTPWLSEYDTSTNVYAINMLTKMPFHDNVIATISNPSTSDIIISVSSFHAHLFEKGFYEELKKLL